MQTPGEPAGNYLDGNYSRTAEQCNGKPVYKMTTTMTKGPVDFFLYQPEGTPRWTVSRKSESDNCEDQGELLSTDVCPESPAGSGCSPGTWQQGTWWYTDVNVTVRALQQETAAAEEQRPAGRLSRSFSLMAAAMSAAKIAVMTAVAGAMVLWGAVTQQWGWQQEKRWGAGVTVAGCGLLGFQVLAFQGATSSINTSLFEVLWCVCAAMWCSGAKPGDLMG